MHIVLADNYNLNARTHLNSSELIANITRNVAKSADLAFSCVFRQNAIRRSAFYHRVRPQSFIVVVHHKVSGSNISRMVYLASPNFTRTLIPYSTATSDMTSLATPQKKPSKIHQRRVKFLYKNGLSENHDILHMYQGESAAQN